MNNVINFIFIFIIIIYLFLKAINKSRINRMFNIEIFNNTLDETIFINDDEVIIHKDSKKKLVNGYILFDKYEVKKNISYGNMSEVYLVRNIKLGNFWVLKVINYYDNAGLFREEGILRNINHISIPNIVDVYYKGNTVYIIEDYIEGVSLDKLIKENGNFSQKQIIKWGIELCDILSYLHNRKPYPIIFRDLKPSNIIITNNNKIVLIDFGISKYKGSLESDYISSGTRKYAPYEQFSNEKITDEKTDIFSLGMMLSECILGYVPVNKNDLKKMLNFVDIEIVLILIKAIADNREKRYDYLM
ncbi:serine/threonine-protein kinase [Clostridiaceae bacterium HSG29]|nr:serine/threonine-protein kinase [Clostridiaceae bacterium HSG29]